MLKNLANDNINIKRTWRTPSPSSTTPIKSPRYLRVGLFRKDSSKQLKYDSSINTNNQIKPKPMLHSFKNQFIQMKQQANKTTNADINDNNTEYFNKQLNLINDYKQQKLDGKGQSYGAYFVNTLPNKQQVKNINSSNKSNGGYDNSNSLNSHNHNHSNSNSNNNNNSHHLPSLLRSKHKYQQSIHKLKSQNQKLKQQYKQLFQKYQHLFSYNQQIKIQINQHKKQIQTIKQKYQQKKIRQRIHNQQIQRLKNQIDNDNNNNQLQKANQQILKLKQQIFQLSMQKQNIQLSYKNNNTKNKNCENCKQNNKLILSFNNILQNKLHQIGKKDIIINNLCNDMHKVQIQLKNYEKPKGILNRMNNNIYEINQIVMKLKARQLSNKFMEMAVVGNQNQCKIK